jgi:hypothetical protein
LITAVLPVRTVECLAQFFSQKFALLLSKKGIVIQVSFWLMPAHQNLLPHISIIENFPTKKDEKIKKTFFK